MKIAMFSDQGGPRMGVVDGSEIADVTAGTAFPRDLLAWLPLDHVLEFLAFLATRAPRLAIDRVHLLQPIAAPRKFLAIGANYASHLDKVRHLGLQISPNQIWFNKQTSCINGPYDDLVMPRVSSCLDYEGELVVVIGRKCRHVSAAEASACVAGFMVGNDASVRDWQLRTSTMTLGKSFDTHGPIGPWLVTPDEVGNPHALSIRTWVNGELRQDGTTAEMRHDIYQQISELSTVMTLEPGDLLSTGTPAGTAIEENPPRYLQVGDRVRIEIERIGFIENRVVADRG